MGLLLNKVTVVMMETKPTSAESKRFVSMEETISRHEEFPTRSLLATNHEKFRQRHDPANCTKGVGFVGGVRACRQNFSLPSPGEGTKRARWSSCTLSVFS